jgi:hypothetical protein
MRVSRTTSRLATESWDEILFKGARSVTPHFLQTKLKPLFIYLVLGELTTFGEH